MAVHLLKSNLTRGEVTPLSHARQDAEFYTASAAAIRNFQILKEGGVRRRSGTRYLGATKFADKRSEAIPFIFNETQSYSMEFGDQYIRWWTSAGQLQNTGVPVEIASPYLESEVARIHWTQTNDVMYLAHPNHKPKELRRLSHTSWTLTDFEFKDGPYLPINDTTNTFTISALPLDGNTIQFATANTTNVNGGDGFQATDVGRAVRFQTLGRWTWCEITAINSTTNVDLLVKESPFMFIDSASTTFTASSGTVKTGKVATLTASSAAGINGGSGFSFQDVGNVGIFVISGNTWWGSIEAVESTLKVDVKFSSGSGLFDPSISWRLGAYSDTTGWPGSVSFDDTRLVWARTDANPRGLGFSRSGLPNAYAPSASDGTVADDHGMFFEILGGRADEIQWIAEAPRLQIGTASAIRSIGAASLDEALAPRNVKQKRELNQGTVSVPPVQVGPSTVHAGRYAKTIRDLFFDFQLNTLVAPNLTILTEHAVKRGVHRFAFVEEPDSVLWTVTVNGELIGTTLERYERVVGMHRHPMRNAFVESLSAIPDPDNQRDALMLHVKREIDGSTIRYVEVVDPPFDNELWDKEDAFYVDCGVTYSGAPANEITGLDHLEGEVVDVFVDGNVHPQRTVTSGTITLQPGVTGETIQIGIPIDALIRFLRPAYQGRDGNAIGRKQNVFYTYADVLETMSLKARHGTTGKGELLKFRKPSDPMDTSPPPFTGTAKFGLESGWEDEGIIELFVDQPVPATIRAINYGLEVEP